MCYLIVSIPDICTLTLTTKYAIHVGIIIEWYGLARIVHKYFQLPCKSGPLSTRQQNAIRMAFRWWVDNGSEIAMLAGLLCKRHNMRYQDLVLCRLAPVFKTIFHHCVISYTFRQSNSDDRAIRVGISTSI